MNVLKKVAIFNGMVDEALAKISLWKRIKKEQPDRESEVAENIELISKDIHKYEIERKKFFKGYL
jgi:hypothetical protein